MNGKIANRTIPLFRYPSVGVTGKGNKSVELNSLQNINWLTRMSLVHDIWDIASPSLVRSALLCLTYYISAQIQKKYNSVFYIFTQTIAVSQYAFLSVLGDL